MTTLLRPSQDDRGPFQAIIAVEVMKLLGTPKGLFRVQVAPLWDDTYRVNVFVNESSDGPRIARSYFLRTDDDGKILTAKPEIKNCY